MGQGQEVHARKLVAQFMASVSKLFLIKLSWLNVDHITAIPEIIVGGSEGSQTEIWSMLGLSHVKSYVLSNEWPYKNGCMVGTKIKCLLTPYAIIYGIELGVIKILCKF